MDDIILYNITLNCKHVQGNVSNLRGRRAGDRTYCAACKRDNIIVNITPEPPLAEQIPDRWASRLSQVEFNKPVWDKPDDKFVPVYSPPGPKTADLASEFLRAEFGEEPTPDAVRQLVEAFLPCLEIIQSRGYEPDGGQWKRAGWRGNLYHLLNRAIRLRGNCWERRRIDRNNAIDIMNYAGFFLRGQESDPENLWGEDFGVPDGEA